MPQPDISKELQELAEWIQDIQRQLAKTSETDMIVRGAYLDLSEMYWHIIDKLKTS